MPSIGSITKTIRINAEDLAVIEGIMTKEKVTWSGAIHHLIVESGGGGVPSKELPYGIDTKYLDDLNTMAHFMGGSVAEMIRLFDEAANNGIFDYEGGVYIGVPDLNLGDFKDACHDASISPQEAIDKVTGMIRKGRF